MIIKAKTKAKTAIEIIFPLPATKIALPIKPADFPNKTGSPKLTTEPSAPNSRLITNSPTSSTKFINGKE